MNALSVRGLGKSYVLRHKNASSYRTFREDVVGGMKILKNALRRTRVNKETFWALRDVSFDVEQGQILGLIGRNGAGKSTLLKVLSKITEPTTGCAEIRGKVASLLEVGTGFHPELTGRENIYLNGTLLGMKKREIDKLFDEIVDFAEVERFLDTPVKRYSSGMYVRLAFAVAAHLSPEVLIIDEVLAVGDAAFQKKSLGRMEEVAKSGRTVLFVSHNMASVSSLCNRCLILDNGQVAYDGPAGEAVLRYHNNSAAQNAEIHYDTGKNFADRYARLIRASLENEHGVQTTHMETRRPVTVRLSYEILTDEPVQCVPNFHFLSSDGRSVFVAYPSDIKPSSKGIYEAQCTVPKDLLNEGVHSIDLAVSTYRDKKMLGSVLDQGALTFNVIDLMQDEFRAYGYMNSLPGAIRPLCQWEVRRLE